jgi:hypothetical protein
MVVFLAMPDVGGVALRHYLPYLSESTDISPEFAVFAGLRGSVPDARCVCVGWPKFGMGVAGEVG